MTPRDLYALLSVFNFCPAQYLHASRREEAVGGAHDEHLWSSAAALPHLSSHILERLGQPPCMDETLPFWRIALLDAGRLARLARHLAAVHMGAQVRRAVRREDVMAWREWLSPEAHEFALRGAGLLAAPVAAARPATVPRAREAAAIGYECLAAAAQDWPEPARARFMLKLPAATDRAAAPAHAAGRLIQSVLPVLEASWCSSFARTTPR